MRPLERRETSRFACISNGLMAGIDASVSNNPGAEITPPQDGQGPLMPANPRFTESFMPQSGHTNSMAPLVSVSCFDGDVTLRLIALDLSMLKQERSLGRDQSNIPRQARCHFRRTSEGFTSPSAIDSKVALGAISDPSISRRDPSCSRFLIS